MLPAIYSKSAVFPHPNDSCKNPHPSTGSSTIQVTPTFLQVGRFSHQSNTSKPTGLFTWYEEVSDTVDGFRNPKEPPFGWC